MKKIFKTDIKTPDLMLYACFAFFINLKFYKY